MGDSQELERAKRAACSIRSMTDDEAEQLDALERGLAQALGLLGPQRGAEMLAAIKEIVTASSSARRRGVAAADLELHGLRGLVRLSNDRLWAADGDPDVWMNVQRFAVEEMELIQSSKEDLRRKVWRERTSRQVAAANLHASDKKLAKLSRGAKALQPVNQARHAQKIAEEDRWRSDIERRRQSGKSLGQIAAALGWSKTKVAGAVKRWGVVGPRSRKNRSGQ